MKKLFIFLFVLIAIFAFTSCNQEPQEAEPAPAPEPAPGPEPAPEPAPEADPVDSTVYVLTATVANDRFQFKWDTLAVKGGDVVTFKYKTEKTVTSHTIRSITPDEKFVNGAALSGEPVDGWYTYSYTIPEGKTATGLGVALFVEGGASIGDVLKIKEIQVAGKNQTLAQGNSWAGCEPTIAEAAPDYYRLTATREAKRFGLKYIGGEGEGAINPKAGDVLTLKYRTNHAVTHIYLHDYAYEKQLEKKASIDPYISEADEDGWITFTFTYPEKESFYDEVSGTISGIYLQLTNYLDGAHEDGMGKFAVDDYLEIKDFKFNGTALTIDPAGDDGKSDHGVWNQAIDDTNTDHTIPTLEEIYL